MQEAPFTAPSGMREIRCRVSHTLAQKDRLLPVRLCPIARSVSCRQEIHPSCGIRQMCIQAYSPGSLPAEIEAPKNSRHTRYRAVPVTALLYFYNPRRLNTSLYASSTFPRSLRKRSLSSFSWVVASHSLQVSGDVSSARMISP